MTERHGREHTEEMVFDAFIQYDERALLGIRDLLGRALKIYAIKRLRDPEKAQEIINDVLVNLWKSDRAGFKEYYDIRKYLYRSVNYACLKAKLQKTAASKNEVEYAEFLSEEDLRRDAESAEMSASMAEQVFEAFAFLPSTMRQVMELHYIHKIKLKKVAVILQMKPSTAANLKMRAKKLLTKRFRNTSTTAEKLMQVKNKGKIRLF